MLQNVFVISVPQGSEGRGHTLKSTCTFVSSRLDMSANGAFVNLGSHVIIPKVNEKVLTLNQLVKKSVVNSPLNLKLHC